MFMMTCLALACKVTDRLQQASRADADADGGGEEIQGKDFQSSSQSVAG